MCGNHPIDNLTEADRIAICQYVSSYANCEVRDFNKVFGYWNTSKQWLFDDVFGGKLRFKVHVNCDNVSLIHKQNIYKAVNHFPISCLQDIYEYDYTYDPNTDCNSFNKSFMYHMCVLYRSGLVSIDDVSYVSKLFRSEYLSTNRIELVGTKKYVLYYSGKSVDIVSGAKTLSTIRKIATLYGFLPYHDYLYKEFADKISTITSVKTIDRELTLSIHPIDYLTMSDNNSGWTSCMGWMNNGSCSSGVIEMLNSPNTVVAYFENEDEDFVFNGYRIPNKSFRVLITITPDMLLVGKSYPYGAHDLSKAILTAVEDVIPIEYERSCELYSYSEEELKDTDTMVVTTYGMYNDVFEACDVSYFCSRNTIDDNLSLMISGKATCMSCGNPLTNDPTVVDGDHVGGNIKYCFGCACGCRCQHCHHIDTPENIKIIDEIYKIAQKTVMHKKEQICLTCLEKDFKSVGVNVYIDKLKHVRYNELENYNDLSWTHTYMW